MANTSDSSSFTNCLQYLMTSGWQAARSWSFPDDGEIGGGCGGSCASAAGPTVSTTAIVKTQVRNIHHPLRAFGPPAMISKLSHIFFPRSVRWHPEGIFLSHEANLLQEPKRPKKMPSRGW